ncbi:DnaB helicase C-terminal domain-containing protein [Macrococcus psychrotolerans]|uniref:DnaB helicase C-terminal domain-containing protein n=1 Tax=Macrococcus psychrotolerans TaxID=3039389 RepID=A0AAU6RL24_9STAP
MNEEVVINERFVVGSLMKYPELLSELKLKPEMLSDYHCKNFISYITSKGIDLNAIYVMAKQKGNEFFPSKLLFDLRNDEFIKKSFFTNFQIQVLEEYKKRESLIAAHDYLNSPKRDNLIEFTERLNYLASLAIDKSNRKAEAITEILEEVNLELKPQLIKTSYDQVDSLIAGFEPGQLVIIAARPSVGKTAFAINLALNFLESGCNVSFFSLETTYKKVLQRYISATKRINSTKFKYPDSITSAERLKITEALQQFKDSNFRIIDDSLIKPSDIAKEAQYLQQTENKKNIIVIDYLTLMKSDGSFRDRRIEVEDISRKLKIFAKQYNCVIIALSQLSRGIEHRQDKRPMMSDIRESGSIEQDADIIAFLHRDDYYRRAEEEQTEADINKSIVELLIAKNKDGSTGSAELEFYKNIGVFYGKDDRFY